MSSSFTPLPVDVLRRVATFNPSSALSRAYWLAWEALGLRYVTYTMNQGTHARMVDLLWGDERPRTMHVNFNLASQSYLLGSTASILPRCPNVRVVHLDFTGCRFAGGGLSRSPRSETGRCLFHGATWGDGVASLCMYYKSTQQDPVRHICRRLRERRAMHNTFWAKRYGSSDVEHVADGTTRCTWTCPEGPQAGGASRFIANTADAPLRWVCVRFPSTAPLSCLCVLQLVLFFVHVSNHHDAASTPTPATHIQRNIHWLQE